jgi:ketosteroid isomerase-like protein
MNAPDDEAAVDPSVSAAIARLHAAMADVAMGDVAAIKALYSHGPDVTSFFGWGGYERGWEAVAKRWDWAGRQFEGGRVSHENVTTVVSPEMFFVTDVETYTDQHVAGVEGTTGWTNRVTHVFRREDGQWRLVHRHANRLEVQYEPSTRLEAGGG